MGVPVVATRIGGVGEILENDRQGLLVPPDDEAALADALESLLRDPERRRTLGAAGRSRVKEFSMERMIRRTEDVYKRLCGTEKGAGRAAASRTGEP